MFAAERWAGAFINACEGSGGVAGASPAEGVAEYRKAVWRQGEASPSYSQETIRQSESGLLVFKAAFDSLSHLSIPVSGSTAAAQFNGFLGAALQKCGYEGGENGVEAARAMIFLLIQRNFFQHIGALIGEIESLLLKKQKILTVTLDCAQEPDDDFLDDLREVLKKRENAPSVHINVVLMPELIGGCRINIGGEREDFSVAGQMGQMEQALTGE